MRRANPHPRAYPWEPEWPECSVLAHEFILREMWGPANADDVQYLRVYIRHLREKLEADPTRAHPHRDRRRLPPASRLIAPPLPKRTRLSGC